MSRIYSLPNFREGQPLSARDLNRLVEAIRDIDSRMRISVSGGLSASWGEALCIGASQRPSQVASESVVSHPFQITIRTVNDVEQIFIRGGVVNNAIEIAGDTNGTTPPQNPCYPAVSMGFTINSDGTVLLTSASVTLQYTPSGSHVTINGGSCQMFVFLGKVYTPEGMTGLAVDQWITGNFFAIPLGTQKQVWYA